MMPRRQVLQLLSLSALAVAGGSALTACGSDDAPDPGPSAAGGVELVSADVARVAGDDAAVPGLVAGLHASSGGLFGSVGAALAGKNVAISPYSVLVAMALTLNGAKGETLEQIVDLYGGADVAEINGGLNALTAHVEGLAGPVEKRDGTKTDLALDAANTLFGQQGVTWEQPFLDVLAGEYGAGLQTVDYVGATEAARGAINGWTAEQTHDKIPEIIPPDVLDEMTRLVLVNTLYLKAPWEQPFEKALTADAPFTRLDGSTVDVAMMDAGGPSTRPGGTGDGWTALQLTYAGQAVAMTVILPDADRFEAIETDVVGGALPTYLSALEPLEATVKLPRWTFRTTAELTPPLQALGVTDAFTPEADFSAMTTDEDLLIGNVLHQVFIAVDEEGTEAAAATAVVGVAQSMPRLDLEFVADRPYLFVIHDVEHGTPLFLGRVLDPTEE